MRLLQAQLSAALQPPRGAEGRGADAEAGPAPCARHSFGGQSRDLDSGNSPSGLIQGWGIQIISPKSCVF